MVQRIVQKMVREEMSREKGSKKRKSIRVFSCSIEVSKLVPS